ncbi:MAG: glycosyltransferase [Lewinellaceae bacterium]|nr:glycosyltransferase [Phaeodactylibacter sp.]MCB0616353.1 glycosyltransferase [Phaeodactylibacter sp.]MCB9349258.1 glycosyltransferase [Lewinellaceae bacterium]
MNGFLAFILWLSLLGILHSYFFYPLLLRWLARGKKPNQLTFTTADSWPQVSIIMSAYNEQAVIREKMESLLQLNYPKGKLQLYIGSDCSNDQTNVIISGYAAQNAHLHFFPFPERRGKPGVINQLTDMAIEEWGQGAEHIFIITDASVMMDSHCAQALARHFKNPKIDIVDAHMVHVGMKEEGISQAEDEYISSEVQLKHREGVVWGKMIGPFGGCFALRANRFSKVPPNFLVDDFFLTMKVFEQGGNAINDLEATCREPVSHEIKEEFRRKARISAGNFQNLMAFPHLWWPPVRPLAFAFFSHKVLRWLGPFFILLILLTSGLLALGGNLFYTLLFSVMVAIVIMLPLLDVLFNSLGLNLLPLRGARYFIMMNLALLQGFINFIKGIRSNVWEPTKRDRPS